MTKRTINDDIKDAEAAGIRGFNTNLGYLTVHQYYQIILSVEVNEVVYRA